MNKETPATVDLTEDCEVSGDVPVPVPEHCKPVEKPVTHDLASERIIVCENVPTGTTPDISPDPPESPST